MAKDVDSDVLFLGYAGDVRVLEDEDEDCWSAAKSALVSEQTDREAPQLYPSLQDRPMSSTQTLPEDKGKDCEKKEASPDQGAAAPVTPHPVPPPAPPPASTGAAPPPQPPAPRATVARVAADGPRTAAAAAADARNSKLPIAREELDGQLATPAPPPPAPPPPCPPTQRQLPEPPPPYVSYCSFHHGGAASTPDAAPAERSCPEAGGNTHAPASPKQQRPGPRGGKCTSCGTCLECGRSSWAPASASAAEPPPVSVPAAPSAPPPAASPYPVPYPCPALVWPLPAAWPKPLAPLACSWYLPALGHGYPPPALDHHPAAAAPFIPAPAFSPTPAFSPAPTFYPAFAHSAFTPGPCPPRPPVASSKASRPHGHGRGQ